MIKSDRLDSLKTEDYPILKQNKLLPIVVLFTSKGAGVVVYSRDPGIKIGTFNDSRDESTYENYKGKIILEND